MKITIPRPSGDIVIEIDNNDEVSTAARIISAMTLTPPNGDASELERADYNHVLRGAKIYPDDVRTRDTLVRETNKLGPNPNTLPPTLEEVHAWLLDNDPGDGVKCADIAEGIGLKSTTTNTRLTELLRRGRVTRPSRGMWSAS